MLEMLEMLDKCMATMYKSATQKTTVLKSGVILGCYTEVAKRGGGGVEGFLF